MRKTMKTGGMTNPNKSAKVTPTTLKLKSGGMTKAMYGKPMMKKGGKKK